MIFDLGEALYRFLLSHSATPPTYHLRVRGTHQEVRTRLVTSDEPEGRHSQHSTTDRIKTETYTEVVIDFDFRIDLTPNILTDPQLSPVQWSVHDEEPAYRGKMFQEIELPSQDIGSRSKLKASRRTLKRYKTWFRERDAKGLPPWTSSSFAPSTDSELKSSHTVRQWCDDYCASNKLLKEFIYTKVMVVATFLYSHLTHYRLYMDGT